MHCLEAFFLLWKGSSLCKVERHEKDCSNQKCAFPAVSALIFWHCCCCRWCHCCCCCCNCNCSFETCCCCRCNQICIHTRIFQTWSIARTNALTHFRFRDMLRFVGRTRERRRCNKKKPFSSIVFWSRSTNVCTFIKGLFPLFFWDALSIEAQFTLIPLLSLKILKDCINEIFLLNEREVPSQP